MWLPIHIISSVMHAFWLVLTYDVLEDRHIDNVIIKTFFQYILILYYIKKIDSKLPCPDFDVLCDLLLNRRTATWNLFVKCQMNLTHLPAQGGPKTNKINYHNFIFTKHAEKTRHIHTCIRNSSQKGFLEERYMVQLECT